MATANAQKKIGEETAMQFLERNRKQMEAALPKHITVERMMRLVATQLRANPELGKCDRVSFIGSVLQCCFIGLEPGGGLNHISLIPYKGVVKPLIEYQGMVELVSRTPHVEYIFADVVYKHDTVKYEINTLGGHPQKFTHEPNLFAIRTRKSSDISLAYAIAVMANGSSKLEYLTTHEIQEAHQKKTDPWNQHWSEMAKKTAIRRLYKTLPKTPELSQALEREEDENFNPATLVEELLPAGTVTKPLIEKTLEEELSQDEEDLVYAN